MKLNYTYTLTTQLHSTEDIVVSTNGAHVFTMNRIYSNRLKKIVDGIFDYRYFLQYDIKDAQGQVLARCKKMQRKGRMWFEAQDLIANRPLIVNYENWRVGIPELLIKGQDFKMKIDKEMEDWSNFLIGDEVVARWLGVYQEETETFDVIFEVMDERASTALLLVIAQTTLFIGA